jgi:glycosyltransferase involved in cell wall biosynthesis
MFKISIVTTVLNDRKGCADFFEQMKLQTLLPSEIVIVDGGSKDGTWEYIEEKAARSGAIPFQVFQDVGCNVARGRDIAIQHANLRTLRFSMQKDALLAISPQRSACLLQKLNVT